MTMWRRAILSIVASALIVGQPAPALARSCEDICADRAAETCDNIDSIHCAAFIAGCLAGCSVGKALKKIFG